jgi:PASTA domain
MPDLTGRGIREAVAMCSAQGLKLKASGDGVVTLQTPSPGMLISQETICRVKLSKEAIKKAAIDAPAKPPPDDSPRARAARTN